MIVSKELNGDLTQSDMYAGNQRCMLVVKPQGAAETSPEQVHAHSEAASGPETSNYIDELIKLKSSEHNRQML